MKHPVAIVGIGCIFPDAPDLARYWANIKRGHDAIREVPESHWPLDDYYRDDPTLDFTYARRGGFIPPTDFDPLAFGIVPDNLEATDTTQLLGMLVAQQALTDAGFDPEQTARDKVSVVLGVTGTLPLVIPLGARLGHPIWRRALDEAGVEAEVAEDVVERIADAYVPWKENSFPGLLGNVVAGRIANRLDLHGTNCVVDAACASSLSAAHLAALELESGRADLVVTGGLDTFNDIFMYMCFSQTPALSPTGDARPFDASGDGTILGEGLGIVVLKRLAEAEADGDRVYAVLKGVGTSSDGRGQAIYAPSAVGQQRALRGAYEAAGVSPDTIGLVETHGTGTKVGDGIEATALTEVYREARSEGTWCALGSVKSQIGHTKAAAGAAGLIKAALALHHRVLPPTIKVEQPLEVLAPGTTPFYVNTEARPWLPRAGHPRRAAVSAFGFGGSNFHCVLEEHVPSHPGVDWTGTVQLVPIGGSTRPELLAGLEAWEKLDRWDDRRARAAQLRATFDPRAALRLIFVCTADASGPDLSRARALLSDEARSSFTTPDGVCFEGTPPLPSAPLAFLFPGQGAQYPGMLRDLACAFPQVQEALAAADAAAGSEELLSDRIYPHSIFGEEARAESADALRATDRAQPALGAVSLGALEVLRHFGLRPDLVAGHSYGELMALHAAGVLSSESLHALSNERGQLMAGLAADGGEAGTMLAVSCELARLDVLLAEAKLELVIANRNTPRQNVLSGTRAAIDAAETLLAAQKISCTRLQVAAAFHSPLVADAEAPFFETLSGHGFGTPAVPVYANSTAAPYPADPGEARALLSSQLARPVEFCRSIEAMHAAGVRTFVEVGPGARLTGMVGRILPKEAAVSIALDGSAGRRDGLFDLALLLARVAVTGRPLRLDRWDPRPAPLVEAEEGKKPRRPKLSVSLTGANYVSARKPRPPRPALPTQSPLSPPVPPSNSIAAARPTAPAASAPMAAPVAPAPVAGPKAAASAPLPPPTRKTTMHDDDHRLEALHANLQALLQMQSQTADLHRLFLEGQEAAQASFRELIARQQGLVVGAPMPAVAAADAVAAVPAPQPVVATPAPAADAATVVSPVSDSPDLAPALLSIVAERTGYPVEVLELDMDLDTDLGIDSIKRVEILSALQAKLPHLPAPRPEELAELRTLGEIVAFMDAGAGATASGSGNGVAAADPASSRPAVGAGPDLSVLSTALLEVVSEKTGYPVEVLELDMDLDTDLGIDSIKRVEILSALQGRHPELPAPRPEELTELRTLGAIVDFLTVGAPGSGHGVAASRPAPTPASPLAAAPAPEASEPVKALVRSAVVSLPLEAEGADLELPGSGICWLVGESGGPAATLQAALQARGRKVSLHSWTEAVTAALPEQLAALILVAPASQDHATVLGSALELLRRAHPKLLPGALVASVSAMDGQLGSAGTASLETIAGGALAGLIKTAAREWPQVQARVLDLEPTPVPGSEVLLSALLAAGPVERALSSAGLSTLELAEQSVPTGGTRLGPEDRILLTGGARGVTAAAALALAQETGATLLLLGRSPAPQPEPAWIVGARTEAELKRVLIEQAGGMAGNGALAAIEAECQRILRERELSTNLQRLAAAGSRVLYRSVDLRDASAVAAVVAELSAEIGAPTAVVHGAGVLADALLTAKTREELERVYATKVQGWLNLRAALGEHPLKALAFFSSTTARLGRKGQADYAAANEALNKLAHLEQAARPETRVVSIGWGPWEGGMVTPSLARIFAQEGVPLIPLDLGGRLLVDELRAPAGSPVETLVLGGRLGSEAATPGPGNGKAPNGKANGQRNGKDRQPAPPQSDPASVAFNLSLLPREQVFLSDHVIAGQAVLPLALSAEWMVQAAMHEQPGLAFLGFDELQLLKGVRLAGAERRSIELAFGPPSFEAGVTRIPTQLRERGGRANLKAVVLLGEAAVAAPTDRIAAEEAGGGDLRLPFDSAELYEVLFHGPAWRGIDQLITCSATAIQARIHRSPSPTAWLESPIRSAWVADPLALDAAFQLGILWSVATRSQPCLPSRVGSYRQWVSAFPETMLLRAQVRSLHGQTLRMDFDWLGSDGALLARLQDAEMILDGALTEAFRRRRLPGGDPAPTLDVR